MREHTQSMLQGMNMMRSLSEAEALTPEAMRQRQRMMEMLMEQMIEHQGVDEGLVY
jgi:hypothetical protein